MPPADSSELKQEICGWRAQQEQGRDHSRQQELPGTQARDKFRAFRQRLARANRRRSPLEEDLRQQQAVRALLAVHDVSLKSLLFFGSERVFQVAFGNAILLDVAVVHNARDKLRAHDYAIA